MADTEIIERARRFALEHHGDQKYGEAPYSKHLDEVAEIVGSVARDDTKAMVVAFLHDVVEDTAVTVEMVRAAFDTDPDCSISMSVANVTDEPGRNRKEKKRATYEKLRQLQGPIARLSCLVKLADRLANVRACVRDEKHGLLLMYQQEHTDFRAAVYREEAEWAPLMDELDRLLG